MKTYFTIILAAVFVSACGSKEPSSSSNTQSTASTQSMPAKAESPQTTASESTSGAPVEFIYGGSTTLKTSYSSNTKANTAQPLPKGLLALETIVAVREFDEQTITASPHTV